MSLDADLVETVTVDSYGTLVDPDAARDALVDVVADPAPVADLWRSRSLLYAMVSNFIDAYQPFYEMNRDALQYALDAHGVEVDPAERDAVLEVYHELDAFDDVRDGLERISDAGYDVYVVSNGNPEMLASMVEHADLGDVVADTVSADEVETFKPHSDIYRHAAARTGTPADRIVHAANSAIDVLGAKHVGMQGAWVNREGAPWDGFAGRDPDLEVETFHGLADALDA